MPRLRLALVLLLAAPAGFLAAQQSGPQPNAESQREILAVRESAWRSWFANDRAGTAQETTGRGTENFVHRQGRWVHTGWHLDTVGD
jgi:hypothetical protein